MSADVSDGDLARLARGGDPVAFRLLVERHQPMVRARARQLAPIPATWTTSRRNRSCRRSVLFAAVPQPEGFAWLAQEIFAEDYHGAAVTFRGHFRTPEGTGLAGLFLRIMKPRDLHGPFTTQAALADPANHIVTLEGPGDWTTREVTASIRDDANTVAFGIFLAGSGRIELRDPEFTRGGLALLANLNG